AGVAPEDVPLWYGVIFMVNMQMAFLSPPFGYSRKKICGQKEGVGRHRRIGWPDRACLEATGHSMAAQGHAL
ncbi:hypothetical protein EN856_37240, partial [Mesorhizobium sp. M8A.F.Ca.ET.213.01.1.1]|uniref:hypothetical protein n=1 Tax=Mesorhizobium sp. M8A.F.Ca.ET.213.01.1.1 TaxID=2563970 RepID=UPI0010919E97